jgi:predicted N-acyltransferase
MHFVAHAGLRKAVHSFLVRERRQVEKWIEVGRDHSQLKAPPPSNEEQEPGSEIE